MPEPSTHYWMIGTHSAECYASDGTGLIARVESASSGYYGSIRTAGAFGSLCWVRTDTCPTMDDALRAAEELLRAMEGHTHA